MRTVSITIILVFLLSSVASSQQYHNLEEIMKIITDSELAYNVGPLQIPQENAADQLPLLENGLFLKKLTDGGSRVTRFHDEYANNADYQENFELAEAAFAERKFQQAQEAYLKVLALAPEQSQVMTYIGQIFYTEGDDSTAIVWYERAVAANYFDYMAHWFLADVYEKTGRQEEALKEVLVASILNRNNPRLFDALQRILKGSGLIYEEWALTPHYELRDMGNNEVSIKYDQEHPEWLIYSLCKAVWQFEPGYKESMTKDIKEHSAIIEERECFGNVLIELTDGDGETENNAFKVAQKALNEGMFSEYLVYEIILPRNPGFVFNLTKDFIDSISTYISKFRTTQSE